MSIVLGYKKRVVGKSSKTEKPVDLATLLTGKKVTSRYWQTVRENGQRSVEVQYNYENQSYKTQSQPLSEKQLKKLTPGEEITVRVNPQQPHQGVVEI